MIEPAEMATVRSILRDHLPAGSKVFVFGSRVTNKIRRGSDLDLAIDVGRKLNRAEENALCFAFEDSNLNYKVDLLDLHKVSAQFKALIADQFVEVEYQ